MISLGKNRAEYAGVREKATSVDKQALEIMNGASPLERGVHAVSGVLRFASIVEMEDYVRATREIFRQEYDKTTEFIASLLRALGERASARANGEFWDKVGTLFINSKGHDEGQLDVAVQIINDLKPKLARLDEVVDDFRHLNQMPVPLSSTVLVYFRNGIPERIVVDPQWPSEGRYQFSEDYDLV